MYVYRPQIITYGLNTRYLDDYVVRHQQKSLWCWAACVEMLFKYYNVMIKQEDVVRQTLGLSPGSDIPNVSMEIKRFFEQVKNLPFHYRESKYWLVLDYKEGAPRPQKLVSEIGRGRPVLIVYQSGRAMCHAVLITAVSFYIEQNTVNITQLIVRDPSKELAVVKGRVVYSAIELAQFIKAYSFVEIRGRKI